MGKLRFIATCLTFTLVGLAIQSPTCEAEDILIGDFEAADYGDWKVEGEAFGTGPARGTLGGQMHVSGFDGKGLVNTFLGGDRPTGKLTSSAFTIELDYIKFLIGGGGHPGKTCMNLLGLDRSVAHTNPTRKRGKSRLASLARRVSVVAASILRKTPIKGGALAVESLQAYELNSAWKKK